MSDIKMPQLSGLEVLEKVKQINPDLPVILVSGYIDKDILLNAMTAGVFAALEKPFKANVLISYAEAATRHYNLLKMIRKTLKLLVYQSSDLDSYLKSQGKTDIANTLKNEIKELLKQFKELNSR
jgi:hypothetical protein